MREFDYEDVISYLAGQAAPELVARIDEARKHDGELAALIDVLRAVPDDAGVACLPPTPLAPTRRGAWRAFLKRAAAMVLVIAGLGGMVWAGYQILAPRPLLHDNFNDEWIDSTKWMTARRFTVEEAGHLRLNNRGSIRTAQEFAGPIEVELDWRWKDLAGDSLYRDTLTVVLHTGGKHRDQHPFRTVDGIEIAFQASGGQIAIASLPNAPDEVLTNGMTKESDLPMPANKWHHIKIVDDGKSIAVYFSGPEIDPKKHQSKPVLTVKYAGQFKNHHIVIHNRELVAEALHESHIDNVIVRSLAKGKAGS